jgi:hypothetical protein
VPGTVLAICDEQKGGLGHRAGFQFFCFSKNPRDSLTGRVMHPSFISDKVDSISYLSVTNVKPYIISE